MTTTLCWSLIFWWHCSLRCIFLCTHVMHQWLNMFESLTHLNIYLLTPCFPLDNKQNQTKPLLFLPFNKYVAWQYTLVFYDVYLLCTSAIRNMSCHSMKTLLVWDTKGICAVDSNEYFLELIILDFDLSKEFDLVDCTVIIEMYFVLNFWRAISYYSPNVSKLFLRILSKFSSVIHCLNINFFSELLSLKLLFLPYVIAL